MSRSDWVIPLTIRSMVRSMICGSVMMRVMLRALSASMSDCNCVSWEGVMMSSVTRSLGGSSVRRSMASWMLGEVTTSSGCGVLGVKRL